MLIIMMVAQPSMPVGHWQMGCRLVKSARGRLPGPVYWLTRRQQPASELTECSLSRPARLPLSTQWQHLAVPTSK
jgi:hypothetical protein